MLGAYRGVKDDSDLCFSEHWFTEVSGLRKNEPVNATNNQLQKKTFSVNAYTSKCPLSASMCSACVKETSASICACEGDVYMCTHVYVQMDRWTDGRLRSASPARGCARQLLWTKVRRRRVSRHAPSAQWRPPQQRAVLDILRHTW